MLTNNVQNWEINCTTFFGGGWRLRNCDFDRMVITHEKSPRFPEGLYIHDGGDEGNRTPDLLTASQALSQLSYAPVTKRYYRGMFYLMQEFFWFDSHTYGFSWDGAEITTLRAIISIHRPDKTLMR